MEFWFQLSAFSLLSFAVGGHGSECRVALLGGIMLFGVSGLLSGLLLPYFRTNPPSCIHATIILPRTGLGSSTHTPM